MLLAFHLSFGLHIDARSARIFINISGLRTAKQRSSSSDFTPMEKDRLSRGTQHQFSIYSNKGGIIVKEEVSSEKAFSKAVKDICINELSTQPLMERNASVNFDHSVVDGVLAIERAREPALRNLTGSVESDENVSGAIDSSGPVKLKKLGVDGDSVEVSQTTMDEGEVAQKSPKMTLSNEADSTTVQNATDSVNVTNASINDRKTDGDHKNESKNSDEVTAGTGTGTGSVTDTGMGEKPVSPSKEKAQNQMASPMKSSGGNNTSDSGPNSASIPSMPNSPIPYSDCISNRSDSTSTSNRSFAFPVLQREWISSPVKMENAGRSNSRKSRGCSAFFCCN